MNQLLNKIANIPFVWNTAQNIIGANQWKSSMYPSAVDAKEGTLLDFGCSSGNETAMFLSFDYYGIDVDAPAIEAAKKKFRAYSNVKFYTVDIIKEGFKKDFFDHVLFAGTAHHLSDAELGKVFRILLDNLKPGGQLHFIDPISQPEKDVWRTRFIIGADQGKNVRTEEVYRKFFSEQSVQVTQWKIFPNPYRFIRFPDFLYVRVIK